MPQVVNTNIMSLNSQRQLNKTQSAINTSMERLSSGLRINSAKDDAAGLAISTGMQSQIRGLNQAVRNSNDGISMAQTAEGSMDEMGNILQRMRELSVQAANDTNSSDNRIAIQEEITQLHAELDRIAETTAFNGVNLLDGTGGTTTLQIGANSGETLSFEVAAVTTNDLGLNGDLNKTDLNGGRVTAGGQATDIVEINGVKISAVDVNKENGNAADNIATTINKHTAETGVRATAYNVVEGDSVESGSAITGITAGLEITVGNQTTVTLGATSSMDNLVDTINRDIDGVKASLTNEGALVLTNNTGEALTIGGVVDGSGLTDGTFEGYVALDSLDAEVPIRIHDTGDAAASVDAIGFGFLASNGAGAITSEAPTGGIVAQDDQIKINGFLLGDVSGTAAADVVDAVNALTDKTGVTATETSGGAVLFTSEDGSAIEITSDADTQADRDAALAKVGMASEMGGKVIPELTVNVLDADAASKTIGMIDHALGEISSSRASLGAIQNRLSSTISNLENVSQNLSASNSRIQDADFAAETSELSKAQILQQAGTAMLSQANASAQSVLSLLG